MIRMAVKPYIESPLSLVVESAMYPYKLSKLCCLGLTEVLASQKLWPHKSFGLTEALASQKPWNPKALVLQDPLYQSQSHLHYTIP